MARQGAKGLQGKVCPQRCRPAGRPAGSRMPPGTAQPSAAQHSAAHLLEVIHVVDNGPLQLVGVVRNVPRHRDVHKPPHAAHLRGGGGVEGSCECSDAIRWLGTRLSASATELLRVRGWAATGTQPAPQASELRHVAPSRHSSCTARQPTASGATNTADHPHTLSDFVAHPPYRWPPAWPPGPPCAPAAPLTRRPQR